MCYELAEISIKKTVRFDSAFTCVQVVTAAQEAMIDRPHHGLSFVRTMPMADDDKPKCMPVSVAHDALNRCPGRCAIAH